MPKTVIGIDPGKNGGIVALNDSPIITAIKMPATEQGILDALGECHTSDTHAYLEWIHPAIQGVGKSSMSKLYGNYKALRMALVAASIPFEEVKAANWQKGMGIARRLKTETTTQWKNRLKSRAQELFPEKHFGVRITLANCDALLIAEYGRRLPWTTVKS